MAAPAQFDRIAARPRSQVARGADTLALSTVAHPTTEQPSRLALCFKLILMVSFLSLITGTVPYSIILLCWCIVLKNDSSLSENEFRIRESSEEIMCAKELLTLGQNCFSKVDPMNCSFYVEEDMKNLGQILVHVPPNVKTKNQFEVKSPSGTFLNIDGNFSDSSDSAGESDCENISISRDRPASYRVMLNNHSGSKSTVEGSCPSALAKKPFDSVSKCKRKKKTKKKVQNSSTVCASKNFEVKTNLCDGELMVGDCPPSSPKPHFASSSFLIPGKSLEATDGADKIALSLGAGESVNIQREQKVVATPEIKFTPCDISESGCNMNNIVSTAEAVVTMANNPVTAGLLSFQQSLGTLTSVPATVCMSGINGAGGHIVAVAGMNLGHNQPVLVFSTNSNMSGFASAAAGPSGNLILGNFSGTAMPMTLFPGTGGNKMLSAGQVSLQGGEILKLTSGGLNTVQSLPGGLLALPGAFQLGSAASASTPMVTMSSSLPNAGMSSSAPVIAINTMGTTAAVPVLSDPFSNSLVTSSAAASQPASSESGAETGANDKGLKDLKVEPTFKEDGTVEWNCNVCFKV